MISVCIATYNGATFISEQIESILPQLTDGDEIIISDDASSDDTLSIVRTIAHTSPISFRILENKTSIGYVANFEKALNCSSGDIIFLSDQDDIWHPQKVETCVCQLEKADFVTHDAEIVDKFLTTTNQTFYELRHPANNWIGTVIKFAHLGCCFCFKRDVLQKALPFPPNRKYCTHDNWLYLISETFYSTVRLNEPLIKYRRHEHNASLGSSNAHKSGLFRITYRLYLLYHLLLRSLRHS